MSACLVSCNTNWIGKLLQTGLKSVFVQTLVFLVLSFNSAHAFEVKHWDGVWIGKWGGSADTSVTVKAGRVTIYSYQGASQKTGKTRISKDSLTFGIGRNCNIEIVPDDINKVSATYACGETKAFATLLRANPLDASGNQPKKQKSVELAGPFVTDEDTVADVQRALAAYGYRSGPADGKLGAGTRREIAKFRTDSALSIGDKINEQLLDTLGILDFEKYSKGIILVVDKRAEFLNNKMRQMNSAEILDYLPQLYKEDRRHIDLTFSRPKSIIFIIYRDLPLGTVIRTYASSILNGQRHSWSQSYSYRVDKTTPTGPLIIINEFETGNPMFLYHELIIDEKLVAKRLTRASR